MCLQQGLRVLGGGSVSLLGCAVRELCYVRPAASLSLSKCLVERCSGNGVEVDGLCRAKNCMVRDCGSIGTC